VAQGLGQALWEHAVYDPAGQLVTGELMDYALPRAHLMPLIESSHTETPSPVNPLGVKVWEKPAHRLFAGGGELGGGCPLAARRTAYRYALTPERSGNWSLPRPGREAAHDSQSFEYLAPDTLGEALRLLASGERKILQAA